MIPAPRHPDDLHIKETLYKLNILDTPLEQRFERITRLVCALLNVPISSFSLIDGERQWFKSIQGLDATENTRPESFCAYTILGEDVMVVPDARKDPRFSANPLVTKDPHITFYAGCPVRAPDGRNIGSLCAVDSKIRELTTDQVQCLRDLAHMLEAELKVAQLSRSQYELINELNAAKRLTLIDPLTRIWNADGMQDILQREWTTARDKSPICLIAAELDHKAGLLSRYGRENVDQINKEMAKRFLSVLDAQDAVARIDDGKFLILLTKCALKKLADRAEHIRHTVSKDLVFFSDDSAEISMSFGAATGAACNSPHIEDLMVLSEKALSLAKQHGANRTEIASDID